MAKPRDSQPAPQPAEPAAPEATEPAAPEPAPAVPPSVVEPIAQAVATAVDAVAAAELPPPAAAAVEAVAGYVLGWVDREIDSVPDESGRTHKVKVHTPGLVPVGQGKS